MKIKLDENIPASVTSLLRRISHDADNVVEEGLAGQPDTTVWEAAQQTGRFFVTQDLDFSDLRRFLPGTHCGVLLVRLHNPTREDLQARIETLFHTETPESWSRCFVVVTDRKVRVRRSSARQE